MPDLIVQSLGRVRFLLGGTEARLRTQKHKALALYLISAPARDHPRTTLAELFWETRGARSRASLSQGLHEIRGVLHLHVNVRADPVRLSADHVRFDARQFTDAAGRGEHGRAVRLYGGDFAPGLGRCASPDFERWCDRERTRYQGQAAISLGVLCDRYLEQNDFGRLLTLTQDWARRFPADDIGQKRLEEALRRTGCTREADAVLRHLGSR